MLLPAALSLTLLPAHCMAAACLPAACGVHQVPPSWPLPAGRVHRTGGGGQEGSAGGQTTEKAIRVNCVTGYHYSNNK